jgi:small GTP-binding protein
MNFQNIAPVEKTQKYLDIAFKRARERGKSKKLRGNWLEIVRKKDTLKVDIVKDSIVVRLEKMYNQFPKINDLPLFYIKLMKLTLSIDEFKKSLAAIKWAIGQIQKVHREHIGKIIKCKTRPDAKAWINSFYGRVASILNQIEENFDVLEENRKIMKKYPDIKDMFSICFYGFPNVGKTTLLNQIAGTKAKIAHYAFTTKSINSGYFTLEDTKVQVLDVPGVLAREKMNDIEMQAKLVLDLVADMVVYVFDLSGTGYIVDDQIELYHQIKDKENVLIYINKTDITPKEVVDSFDLKSETIDSIKQKAVALIKEKQKVEDERAAALEAEIDSDDDLFVEE